MDDMDRSLMDLHRVTVDGITIEDMIDKGRFLGTDMSWTSRLCEESRKAYSDGSDSAFTENGTDEEQLERENTYFRVATETKTAETEQFYSAESEENKRFLIRSVVNPQDQRDISLQEAIASGVIRPKEGIYIADTGESLPIPIAMAAGYIKVIYCSTKRTQEKKSSIGIVTVKSIRENSRSYSILTVHDTKLEADVSQEQATELEILDERQGTFRDRKTGRKMLIMEAVELGLVKIEYGGDAKVQPEVISTTYAVRAVADRRLQKMVTFQDAVQTGIIDRDTGAYRDTITGQKMYIGDAIMRGYLKARVVDDIASLNIDVNNKITIDKSDWKYTSNGVDDIIE